MKTILPIVFLSVLVGCASAPSQRTTAASRAKPIVTALAAYHRDTGDYPKQLDELRPRYLAADVPLGDRSDVQHLWTLDYQCVSQDDYQLDYICGPCSEVVYKNGKFIAAYGPAFK